MEVFADDYKSEIKIKMNQKSKWQIQC